MKFNEQILKGEEIGGTQCHCEDWTMSQPFIKNIVVVNVRRDGISKTNENSIPGAYQEVVEAPLTILASIKIL